MRHCIVVGLAVGLAAVSGCAEAAGGSHQGSASMPQPVAPEPSLRVTPFGRAFDILSARQDAPSLVDIERALGAVATPVRRQDRHQEARFENGARFVRVAPALPDGRARLDTGIMTAFVSPVPMTRRGCVSISEARSALVASGWTSPPVFGIERHETGRPSSAGEPMMLSRHDHQLRLYLFSVPAFQACVSRYALAWNMDLTGVMQLLPDS